MTSHFLPYSIPNVLLQFNFLCFITKWQTILRVNISNLENMQRGGFLLFPNRNYFEIYNFT